MTSPQPTAKQRERWRLQRTQLRLLRKNFPAPPKVELTPDEKRELRNYKAREARAAKVLGTINLDCPLFDADGQLIGKKPTRKPAKLPLNRPKGPWDVDSAPQS
jgi:hypothetical protein